MAVDETVFFTEYGLFPSHVESKKYVISFPNQSAAVKPVDHSGLRTYRI